tara:strand:+ start:2896 stop:3357 length:462 start_codon:yes stop_codon:yes gene_type:complete
MEQRRQLHLSALFFIAALCIQLPNAMAQNGIDYPKGDAVKVAEVMPVLKTCASLEDRTERETCTNQSILEHVSQHLIYPEAAEQKKIEGTVFVQFVVTKKGSVGSVEIMRGPDMLQKAAATVIESLPLFVPGNNKGKTVNVQYVLPIRFALTE